MIGLGSDIIEIGRIKEAIKRHGDRFKERHFTQAERAYCEKHAHAPRHYAGRFSAKEAIVKALGTGISAEVSWLDIEILNNERGKPEVTLSSRLVKIFGEIEILVSISHCKEYAQATAIVMKQGENNG